MFMVLVIRFWNILLNSKKIMNMLKNVYSGASSTKEIFQSCKCYPGPKQNKVYDFPNLSLHLRFVIYIHYLLGMKPVKPCCITSPSDTYIKTFSPGRLRLLPNIV